MLHRYILLLFFRELVNAERERVSQEVRIVSGKAVTDPYKYPYIAHAKTCGASLVAPNVLLSAAHCGTVESVTLNRLIVTHGGTSRQTRESFRVLKELVHPGYKKEDMYQYNDFKLIRINGFSSNTPVELDDGTKGYDSKGTELRVMGWGLTSYGGSFSDSLMEVDVDVSLFNVCNSNKIYGKKLKEDMHFCAGRTANGVTYDSCNGDSGGPIVKVGAGTDGNDVQVGVVSFGKGCGNKDFPGVYAKVSAVKDWIDEKISAWDCTPQSGTRRRKLQKNKPTQPGKPNKQTKGTKNKPPKQTGKPNKQTKVTKNKKPTGPKKPKPTSPGCEWKLEWVEHCDTAPTPPPSEEGNFCEFVLSDDNMKTAVELYNTDASEAINLYGDPKYWSTKDVTDMSYLFKSNVQFNADISGWDTSKVTNMDRMFNQANTFNIDIGGWNTAKVTNVDAMFAEAKNFNQDLSMWDLSKVEVFGTMFMEANKFNQDLCPWNNYDNIMGDTSKLLNFLKGTSCYKKATPQKTKFCHECSSCTSHAECASRTCGTGSCGGAEVCSYGLDRQNVLRISMDSGIYGDELSWELQEKSNGQQVFYISKNDLNSQVSYMYDIDVCEGVHELCMKDPEKYGGNKFKISYKYTEEIIKEFEFEAGKEDYCVEFTVTEM